MSAYTLTVLDTTGIQDYIFGSNRVPENVGASQLVEQATHQWVQDSLPLEHHNLNTDGNIDRTRRLEEDRTLEAEVILRGGGNVLILFRSLAVAKDMVSRLTRKLVTDAPGLELAAAHYEFDWERDALGGQDGVHRRLFAMLNRSKQQRRSSTPLLGQSVTLECRATGLPAVGFDPSPRPNELPYPVSADVWAKLQPNLQQAANDRLHTIFAAATQAGYEFRRDFGMLGGTEGEHDYIAVVHADGNGMGKRFERLVLSFGTANQNRACLDALRDLSEAVDRAGRTALEAIVKRMIDAFEALDASEEMQRFLSGLEWANHRPVLPFRPIVYGGDDVTFVCDGRLGLPLAAIYLDEWERATAADPVIGPAYACAGVTVVKTHYPFVRAYHLSVDLCTRTKALLREHQPGDTSALDWHFAMSGIIGSIKEIRQREYQVRIDGQQKSLVMRPVTLRAPGLEEDWRNWQTFERVTRKFNEDPYWKERRNKVKALREVLREGDQATQHFRHAYSLRELPEIDPHNQEMQRTGWNDRCGYFDAIEAMDFFLPLS